MVEIDLLGQITLLLGFVHGGCGRTQWDDVKSLLVAVQMLRNLPSTQQINCARSEKVNSTSEAVCASKVPENCARVGR